MFELPKDDSKYKWTRHSKNKMLFYGISANKIRSIINSPKRKEDGVAENTIAVMQSNHKPKRNEEIWVMYQSSKLKTQTNFQYKSSILNSRFLVISAWRYPGITKPGSPIPIPLNILEELGL